MLKVVDNQYIRSDSAGDGHYLAKRGSRLHRGVDYVVKPYAKVYAPVNGTIVRIAYPYKGDTTYKGVLLQGESITLKIFYFSPISSLIGKKVEAGQVIGYAQDIRKKYNDPNMTPHIHIEVADMDVEKLMSL